MTQGAFLRPFEPRDAPVMPENAAHIVALSGGKDSTAMALRLREVEPDRVFAFVCTPTGNELPEMYEHWRHLERLLGQKLVVLMGGSLGGLIEKWKALPNWRQRWCTRVLKIEPYQAYLATRLPAVTYVGIRADEADREGADYADALVIRRFPLIEWGWGLAEVQGYLAERGVTIPERTDCAACFFQTLGEWHSLWKNHPDQFAAAEKWEQETGHTFRSASRDTWPAPLTAMRARFEQGHRPMRQVMNDRPVMCGVCSR